METSKKEIYRKWADKYDELPLFFNPFWLDAVCGVYSWDVAIVQDSNGKMEGVLPYVRGKRMGMPWSSMPMLTPYLGPYLIRPTNGNTSQVYAFEKRVMSELINQLPSFFYFSQNWLPDYQNWLPFYWRGFQQTTYYTYVFQDIRRTDRLFQKFKSSTRNHIRVASRLFSIKENAQLADFYQLNKTVFEVQGQQIPYDYHFLNTIDEALLAKSQRKLFMAYSEEIKRYEAGIYIVQDQNTAYLLASGRVAGSHSGAVPLLVWHALKTLSKEVERFDFEGSIIPGIEIFFRSFGAELCPYFQVRKARYRWIELTRVLFTRR